MSVPVYRRNENKLQAAKDAIDLATYTIKLCETERIFPKKCRWTLCSQLINKSINLVQDIYKANKIRLDSNKENALIRLEIQNSIMLDMESLWAIMTIAQECYNIPLDKIGNWSNKALKADNTLQSWRNSDKKRFKELFG